MNKEITMATITEGYVSFEVAKLLKEKKMDISCFNHYVQKNNNDGTSEEVTVCTLQMAMKWLRLEHNIYIEIKCTKDNVEAFVMTIEELPRCLCRGISSNKYEEAAEAAIKYCLENLI